MPKSSLDAVALRALAARAKVLRRDVLRMGERVGQGYVGQGLGIADLLTVLYFHEMRYDALRLDWRDRDRFLFPRVIIRLVSTLRWLRPVVPMEELDSYGADRSRLEMAGSDFTPGFEMTGGSLGHGLPQGVGMALGLRLDKREARIFVMLSDGELQEGVTWEAAMSAAHYDLDHLFAFIDCNNQQADGAPADVLNVEPVPAKWTAFGWDTQRINGNNIDSIVAAIKNAKRVKGQPHVIVMDTVMGKGVRLFEQREKAHFIRVEADEWKQAREQLEASSTND